MLARSMSLRFQLPAFGPPLAHLIDGLVHHPGAERADEAALFGDRDEVLG